MVLLPWISTWVTEEEPFVWAKDVVQVFYAPDLENNEGRHIVLQGKRKIVDVGNTTEEEGNRYQDMPSVRADVDLPLFEDTIPFQEHSSVANDETLGIQGWPWPRQAPSRGHQLHQGMTPPSVRGFRH
jgi:hypothetical protein